MRTLARDVCGLAVILGSTGWAQVTQLVSVATSGAQGNGYSYHPSISADGRYAAFASDAANLVPVDTNGAFDVFVRDRRSGTTERVSIDLNGVQGNGASYDPSISAEGRFVVFTSRAADLVPGDTNGFDDVFVRDRLNGTTERVSLATGGTQGDGDSSDVDPFYGPYPYSHPSISADGRYVGFLSWARNLVPGDSNGQLDVFVRDRQSGTTERVSVDSGGVQGNGISGRFGIAISGDGRYVAFASDATNLVPGDTNGKWDVFVHDRRLGRTDRMSSDTGWAGGNDDSWVPSISGDGRYVAFSSNATNLVPGDTNGSSDIFVRDREAGTIERETWGEAYSACISADGRFLAYQGQGWGWNEIFLLDRQAGIAEWVSRNLPGSLKDSDSDSEYPSVSAEGRYVAFDSGQSQLVPEDTNWQVDVFVRDREPVIYPSLCDPGSSGVIGCPCFNPPLGADRGCENSLGTGGASLWTDGGANLSSDSLVLRTSGQRTTALSILLQGTLSMPAGAIYGQGVRCVGGSLKRLFAKSVSNGSIKAPDFLAGDPTVHARSAALGDAIPAGSTRWYMVLYRDPIVLGGCPASSTFNTTQTRAVSWLP